MFRPHVPPFGGLAALCLLAVILPSGCTGPDDDTDEHTDTDAHTDTDTDDGLVDGRWDATTWAVLEGMSIDALQPVPSPSNAVADNAKAATLGQMLFFEKSHSGPITAAAADNGSNGGLGAECELGRVSCESCHQASTPVFTDARSNPPDHSTTLGTAPVGRNVPGAANAVYYDYIGLSGARDSLWAVSAFATNAAPMGSSELTTLHMVAGKYRDLYDEVFEPDLPADLSGYPSWGSPGDGAAFDGMTAEQQTIVSTVFANVSKALAAYQRKLVLGRTAFDDYVDGDLDALDDAEKRGLAVFMGQGRCVVCHAGPHFSDQGFHNIATSVGEGDNGRFSAIDALNGFRYTSAGAFSDDTRNNKIEAYPDADRDESGRLIADESFKGQFRTQTLRGIPDSGPWMHKGNLTTLEAVVAHYDDPPTPDVGAADAELKPLGLTADQQADLVAFLGALSADAIPAALLEDTSRSSAAARDKGLSGYEPSASNLPASHPCAPVR